MNAYDLYTFYIEPADLKGQAVKVKVESVEVAEVFNPGRKKNEPKIILHLVGKKKALSLNKTRTGQMIALTGTPEIEQWKGAEIIIEPAKQSGKDTILIRPAPQSVVGNGQKPTLAGLREKVKTDSIVAYSDITKMAGLDAPTSQAILKECGGSFEDAFNKIAEQYAEILS